MKTVKLLIIDSDNTHRTCCQQQLDQAIDIPHQIIGIESVEKGSALLKKQEIDCILLDDHLPELSNPSALGPLKLRNKQSIPIIVLTDHPGESPLNTTNSGRLICNSNRTLDINALVTLIKSLVRNYYLTKIIEEQKKQIQAFAFYDALTGIMAFTTFYQILKYSIADASHFKHPVGLICVDIDNFVVINDSFGHLAGDEILIEMSKRLVKLASPDSILCRGGQDEFLLLVSDSNIEVYAYELARKIRSELKKPYCLVVDTVGVTISQGIACFAENDSAESLIKKTEEALHIAKKKGGGSIHIL